MRNDTVVHDVRKALLGGLFKFGIVIAAIAATLFLARPARAVPSFDCRKASPGIEVLICSSLTLSNQDSMLAALYRSDMRVAASPADREKLLESQRAWLRSRQSVCSLPSRGVPPHGLNTFRTLLCLTDLYHARNAVLQARFLRLTGLKHSQPKIRVGNITARRTRRAIIDNFLQTLPSFYSIGMVRLESCSDFLSYTMLNVPRDSSYGARCRLSVDGHSLSVLMCNDWLVGKWHIAESPNSMLRKRLIRFIGDDCPPGG